MEFHLQRKPPKFTAGETPASPDHRSPTAGETPASPVYGYCTARTHLGGTTVAGIATLENSRYLIAPGYYPFRLTWSPRFNRYMPEVCDVPNRSGLRFHQGTKPEHSRGCILVSAGALNRIIQLLTNAQKENEPVYIAIE